MDTKTLVVGQDVYMFCGHYGEYGKAVEVTPEGVVLRNRAGGLLRFDSNGKGWYITEPGEDCPGPWYITEPAIY